MATYTRRIGSALVVLLVGCGRADGLSPDEALLITSLTPAASATQVDVGTTIELTFNHPVPHAMEAYVMVHEGGVDGPAVTGTWMWSGTGMHLEFHPDLPLLGQQRYTLHLGGAMQDTEGHMLDYDYCRTVQGMAWAWSDGMHGHQMGAGWMHENGSYGLTAWFETT